MTPRSTPVMFHEVVLAPAVLGLALWHAHRALGARRAVLELIALAAYGFALELLTIGVFASHDYGSAWLAAPLGVPLAVAGVWAAVILSALALAARLGTRSAGARAGAAALLSISLDLLMEPVAQRTGLWRWTPPGPWLGVPVGNFVGWAVIVGVYGFGAERARAVEGALRQAASRLGLGVLSIMVLLLVGFVWTQARAERLFAGAGGWAAWAVLLLAAASLGFRRPVLVNDGSLAGRLGAESGPGPAAVFMLLGAVFAWDALALGDPALSVVATGCGATLLWVLRGALGGERSAGWRAAALLPPGAVELVRVLMKPRNGERWTAEDRTLLRRELRGLARWSPALFVFLLPGGLLLLPAYAWLLDRRRQRRAPAAPGV